MKVFELLILASILMLISSCADIRFGDAGLSKAPESSGATIDSLFSSIQDADKVLVAAYSYLPYCLPVDSDTKLGDNTLESLTDLQQSVRNHVSDGPRNLYYNGALNSTLSSQDAGNEAYRFGSENDYRAIRYGWIFIENAHRIPDITDEVRNRKIAEAKMCIAIAYSNMMRYVGGIPVLDHSIQVNEEMKFPRWTFSDTVDWIVDLIDSAVPYLPWKVDALEDGRMTRAGALGLKLRVLCFAASDTFNSDTPYHPQATEYQCYMNYDHGRWERAKDAADEFMKEWQENGYYDLVQPEEPTHMARRLAYRKGYYDRGMCETLISIRKGYDVGTHYRFVDYNARLYACPTLNWANMYPWEDGTDFPEDFDWKNPPKQPFFTPDGSGNPPGIPTRDPRLYENIAVPGDIYADGTVAPVHKNHPNYKPEGTGFRAMKYVLQDEDERSNRPVHWAYLRLPEVLLSAAEAYNEADGAPSAEAYGFVNRVRARVGLSPLPEGMDKMAFRKAVLKERALEFGYEEVRWFDLVRWGMKDDFTKTLYGLYSTGNEQNNPTEFTFEPFELPKRHWAIIWDSKWYLAPIPKVEIDKNYGMTQNPGW